MKSFNGEAEGFSGRDVFLAKRLPPVPDGNQMVDVGFVGEVVSLDSSRSEKPSNGKRSRSFLQLLDPKMEQF